MLKFLHSASIQYMRPNFSRERERRVLVVWVNCRGKVAPSLDVRSGGVPSLIRTFASLRCAPRGTNPYATDRSWAAAEPTVKIYGITGLYYGGINGRFGGSCWTASNCAPWKLSVIRSPPPVFFGANFARFRLGFLR